MQVHSRVKMKKSARIKKNKKKTFFLQLFLHSVVRILKIDFRLCRNSIMASIICTFFGFFTTVECSIRVFVYNIDSYAPDTSYTLVFEIKRRPPFLSVLMKYVSSVFISQSFCIKTFPPTKIVLLNA